MIENVLAQLSSDLLVRIGFDFVAVLILVRGIYFRLYLKDEFFFTFYTFNLIIFSLSFLLNQVEMSMGGAFGLFAVFSMLRYRTEDISMKDMTYLFMVIALGLINAVAKAHWVAMLLVNGFILLLTFVLESNWLSKRECAQLVIYDNISLISPTRRPELLQDLSTRMGVAVHRCEMVTVDFLKDAATLKIYYYQ